MLVHWVTLFLPPLGVLLVLTALIADFVIKREIATSPDVQSVKAQAAFWL